MPSQDILIGLVLGLGGIALAGGVWWRALGERRAAVAQATTLAATSDQNRQDAERARAESARMVALLDALPYPVWQRDSAQRLTWVNQRYREMVEADQAAVIADQRELASALDPDQPRRLAAKLKGGDGIASETRRFVVDGDRRSFRVQESALPGGGSVGSGHDVTAEEDSRGQLKRHVDAHADMLQNLATAIAVFGPNKRLTLFNRAYLRLWRLDEEWLQSGPRLGEILEALRENRRLPEQVDWQSYKRAQLEQFTTILEPREELMHLPDGTTLRVTVTPHPFGGLFFTFEDVTDRLNLERDRNTLLAVQRATLDNLHEGVVVYGSDGRVGLFNAAFAAMWQVEETFLAGAPHIGAVVDATRRLVDDGGDWDARRSALMEAFLAREPRMGLMDRANATSVRYAAVPLPDGAMLFTYLDVTDTARIERALRERNEALQAADQLKSEFIATVSYELRNPLNSLIGFADLLGSRLYGDLNDKQREYCELIIDSGHQLLMLVNDMLDLAVIESGHMALEPRLFDPQAMIAAIVALTRERARRQDLAVEMDCPPDIGGIIADERRVKQVLFNLVSNAVKFTPPGGRVALSARREGDEIKLSVSDTGLGIPENQQPFVFDKFRKGGVRQPGVGVGLALVRSFIEMHGGRVTLASRPGQGTTVTCWLPARTPPGMAVPAEGRASAAD